MNNPTERQPQTEYVKSLQTAGHLPTSQTAVIADLIDNMDSIPGSTIRHQGEEIWIHTAAQVEGWLSDFLDAYAALSVGGSR